MNHAQYIRVLKEGLPEVVLDDCISLINKLHKGKVTEREYRGLRFMVNYVENNIDFSYFESLPRNIKTSFTSLANLVNNYDLKKAS